MPIEDTPGETAAEEGLVILDGPGGTAVTMTPDAAAQTAERLLDASSAARARDEEAFQAGKAEGKLRAGFAGACPFNRTDQPDQVRDWIDGFGAGRIEAGLAARPADHDPPAS